MKRLVLTVEVRDDDLAEDLLDPKKGRHAFNDAFDRFWDLAPMGTVSVVKVENEPVQK